MWKSEGERQVTHTIEMRRPKTEIVNIFQCMRLRTGAPNWRHLQHKFCTHGLLLMTRTNFKLNFFYVNWKRKMFFFSAVNNLCNGLELDVILKKNYTLLPVLFRFLLSLLLLLLMYIYAARSDELGSKHPYPCQEFAVYVTTCISCTERNRKCNTK